MSATSHASSAGQALRRAREEAGLSRHELAGRMGVSWDTVRRAEETRDPRRSTLLRLLTALPHASPGGLLAGAPCDPPLASDSAWMLHRDVQGHVIRRVSLHVDVQADGSRLMRRVAEGVRGISQDLATDDGRTNLLRAVVQASAGALRALVAEPADLRGRVRTFTDSGVVHELRFPRPLPRKGFTHEARWRVADPSPDGVLRGTDAAGIAGIGTVVADADSPVEMLELRVSWPEGAPAQHFRVHCSPHGSLPPEGAFALARKLHPLGIPVAWDPRKRQVTLSIERPQPHLRYGLAWHPDPLPGFESVAGQAARRGSSRLGAIATSDGAGPALRRRRELQGMSSREAARRARVSAATWMAAEDGADVRASTLTAALRILPALEAAALLAGERSSAEMEPRLAWHQQIALTGLLADEVSRLVKLDARGGASEEIAWQHLRRLRGADSGSDLVIRDAVTASGSGRVGPVLVEGRGAEPLRIRWQRVEGEQPEYHLVIPSALASRGASILRRERKEAAYKLRASDTGRSIGPAFECLLPARVLRLAVRFPRGVRPLEIRASARAAVAVTNPRWPDLSGRLHPDGLAFTWDPASGTASLRVEHPLMGVRYSISWTAA